MTFYSTHKNCEPTVDTRRCYGYINRVPWNIKAKRKPASAINTDGPTEPGVTPNAA